MPLSQLDQDRSDKFFRQIEPVAKAYRFPMFRFIAIRCDEDWVLFHGVLDLGTVARAPFATFQIEHIVAGETPLSALAATPQDFLEAVTSGELVLEGRKCRFPAADMGNYQVHNWDFDGHINKRSQAGKLSISGASNFYRFAQEPWIRRELITSALALDTLAELAAHYDMEFGINMDPRIEIHAPGVGELSESSSLALGRLHIGIAVPGVLDPKRYSISARARYRDGRTAPLQLPLTWDGGGESDWTAVVDAEIGEALEVTCNLICDGFVQQRRVISEPVELRDRLYFAYQLFGGNAASLGRVINDEGIKNRDGRELEYTMSTILALSGARSFSIDHLPGLGEVPDIVAADANSNLLLIECTLKLPNATDKMSKLAQRRLALETALEKAGMAHVRMVALLACSWPNEKLAPFLTDAAKAGIVLWGREDMHRRLNGLNDSAAGRIFDDISNELILQGLMANADSGL